MSPFNIEETILFEDEWLLVCHKPAGIPVQTARLSAMDMESMLKNYLARKGCCGKVPYLGVIHRLDQPVEGIVIFAKTPAAAKELNKQITNGEIQKFYLAVTDRIPEKKQDTLEHELVKDGRTNTSKVVPASTKESKRGVLEYRVAKESQGRALVEIQLHTGRHHQIRVQMAQIGCPLRGDRKYNRDWAQNMDESENSALALCANKITFCHPKKGKRLEFAVEPKGSGFIL